MAEGTKVYYWHGWISPEAMQDYHGGPTWFEVWENSAKQVEADGYRMVVFMLPKVERIPTHPEADPDMIERIELLLQEAYGIPAKYKKE